MAKEIKKENSLKKHKRLQSDRYKELLQKQKAQRQKQREKNKEKTSRIRAQERKLKRGGGEE